MNARRIFQGLKDAIAGNVAHISVVHVNGERRMMTEAEEAALDDAFHKMDEALDAMGKAMDEMANAPSSPAPGRG